MVDGAPLAPQALDAALRLSYRNIRLFKTYRNLVVLSLSISVVLVLAFWMRRRHFLSTEMLIAMQGYSATRAASPARARYV